MQICSIHHHILSRLRLWRPLIRQDVLATTCNCTRLGLHCPKKLQKRRWRGSPRPLRSKLLHLASANQARRALTTRSMLQCHYGPSRASPAQVHKRRTATGDSRLPLWTSKAQQSSVYVCPSIQCWVMCRRPLLHHSATVILGPWEATTATLADPGATTGQRVETYLLVAMAYMAMVHLLRVLLKKIGMRSILIS